MATFAFSQLAKRNRIALILAGIFGGDAESFLSQADEIAYYASTDFAEPYKVPKPLGEVTIAEALS